RVALCRPRGVQSGDVCCFSIELLVFSFQFSVFRGGYRPPARLYETAVINNNFNRLNPAVKA
ncbi:MAG: hypothetical protein MJ096_05210, partial [Clostridia bacterium]|nr:hypothetical protein [Clostridia bacterium]